MVSQPRLPRLLQVLRMGIYRTRFVIFKRKARKIMKCALVMYYWVHVCAQKTPDTVKERRYSPVIKSILYGERSTNHTTNTYAHVPSSPAVAPSVVIAPSIFLLRLHCHWFLRCCKHGFLSRRISRCLLYCSA